MVPFKMMTGILNAGIKMESDLFIVLFVVIDASNSSVQCLPEIIGCIIQQFLWQVH